MSAKQTVFVVDDDSDVLDSLSTLLASAQLSVRAYPSANAFLDAWSQEAEGCLVLDIRMPHISGLELQRRMKHQGIGLPIIFITGHGDVPMAVQAMKNGALEFLQKPFRDQTLLDSVYRALELNRRQHHEREDRQKIKKRLQNLTRREWEVMRHMVAGDTTKVIAGKINLSTRTVEVHRAHVMEKMQAKTLAQLVQMALLVQENNSPR